MRTDARKLSPLRRLSPLALLSSTLKQVRITWLLLKLAMYKDFACNFIAMHSELANIYVSILGFHFRISNFMTGRQENMFSTSSHFFWDNVYFLHSTNILGLSSAIVNLEISWKNADKLMHRHRNSVVRNQAPILKAMELCKLEFYVQDWCKEVQFLLQWKKHLYTRVTSTLPAVMNSPHQTRQCVSCMAWRWPSKLECRLLFNHVQLFS